MYDEEGASHPARVVEVLLFDSSGKPVGRHQISAPLHQRRLLNISELAPSSGDAFGTFCVFHEHSPSKITQLGSHLAERGYVSYRFGNSPLRSYVHGNLDAASLKPDGELQLLGGWGILKREYRVQHELLPECEYQIALVNPSTVPQTIQCDVLERAGNGAPKTQLASLSAGGCHLFKLAVSETSQVVTIRSRLVMARPMIFCIENQRMDVLHG